MKELNGAVDRLEAGGSDQWLGRMSRESVGFLTLSMTARLREANALYFPWLSGTGKAYSNPGFAPRSFMLKALPNHDRLAIEMWLSEEDEARALAGELALLERQWKEAEELAAIADGLSLGEQ